MDSTNSSFHISMDSTFGSYFYLFRTANINKAKYILENVDIPGIDKNDQIRKVQPMNQAPVDDHSTLIERIIRIYLKHPMSLECLMDWVKLLNTRLEDYEKLPPGKVQLMKLFWETHDLANILLFVKCDKCSKSTKVLADQKQGLKCVHCDALLKTNETNFFVILPVEQQIMKSVKNNWAEICEFNMTCNSEDSEDYRDVRDGSILKEILKQYETSDVNVLSLCLNVDGANKFKSNSFSVWPIQLMQNYLPPHCRFLPKNIILNGLYYHKPHDEQLSFHEYLRPLIDEMNHLKTNPISIEIEGELYKLKPVITHCAVDLPAKSKLLEMKQFGGYFACSFCEIPGEKVAVGKPKSNSNTDKNPSKTSGTLNTTKSSNTTKPKYYVRYTECDHSFNLRNESETLQKMLTAAENDGKIIDGIKGGAMVY